MASVPIQVKCYLCGRAAQRLYHPDELTLGVPHPEGFILCNYCNRPVCPDHVSPSHIERLEKIRPQQFCTACARSLSNPPDPG